jgi:hypothetical protein
MPALNGYERVLTPPEMVPDVCYHLNNEQLLRAAQAGSGSGGGDGGGGGVLPPGTRKGKALPTATINTAIEATTLAARMGGARMYSSDAFIQERVSVDDILVVSVGGNDIALMPSCCTICMVLA